MWAIASLIFRHRKGSGDRSRTGDFQPDGVVNDSFRSIGMKITDASRGNSRKGQDTGAESCQQHLPLLYSLARTWAWKAVEFRCQTHPHEADPSVFDETTGDTVLHWCVFGRPPLEVVTALLETSPGLARAANHRGLLPIHVACSYRASTDVIQALIDVYPEGLAKRSTTGSFPLHLACDFGCGEPTLRAILSNEWGAQTVSWVDQTFRRKPLQILVRRRSIHYFHGMITRMRTTRELQRKLSEGGSSSTNGTDCDDIQNMVTVQVTEMEEDELWRELSLLALGEFLGRALELTDDTPDNLLKACTSNRDCPSSVQEFAFLLYEDRLLLRDTDGDCLLHWLVQHASPGIVTEIFYLNPKAAAVRNGRGFLPFELALSNGKLTWKSGISQVFQAHPAALDDLGLQDVLYPTILAKFSDRNALYQCLRSGPDLLKSGV